MQTTIDERVSEMKRLIKRHNDTNCEVDISLAKQFAIYLHFFEIAKEHLENVTITIVTSNKLKKVCEKCQTEFETQSTKARFCSVKCRVANHRHGKNWKEPELDNSEWDIIDRAKEIEMQKDISNYFKLINQDDKPNNRTIREPCERTYAMQCSYD